MVPVEHSITANAAFCYPWAGARFFASSRLRATVVETGLLNQTMNCPHCNKLLPEKNSATHCPFCGTVLPPEVPANAKSPALLAPVRIRWPIFFVVLLSPPLLTLLASFLGRGHFNEGVSPLIALFGGVAAGISCGIMLALRYGKDMRSRIALGLLFSCLIAVVCIMLSFGGCMIGGYQIQMH